MKALLDEVRRSLRRAARAWRSNSILAVVLGMGVAATIATYACLDAAVLHPLPYPDSGQLTQVFATATVGRSDLSRILPNGLALSVIQSAMPAQPMGIADRETARVSFGGPVQPIAISAVSPHFLSTLGLRPALGRGLLPSDWQPGATGVALVGWRFWMQHGALVSAVGSTLWIDSQPYTVIGVMPPQLQFPLPTTQVWIPGAWRDRRGPAAGVLIVRLRRGLSLQAAQVILQTVATRVHSPLPHFGLRMEPLQDPLRLSMNSQQRRRALLLMFCVSGLLLSLTCINVASLWLARAWERQPEVATLRALGARESQIFRPFLLEVVVTTGAGCGFGLLVAALVLAEVRASAPLEDGALALSQLDPRALTGAVALTGIISALFALAPALLNRRMRRERRESVRSAGAAHRGWLLAAQFGLTVALLGIAVAVVQGFRGLTQSFPGFRSRDLMVESLYLPPARASGVGAPPAILRRSLLGATVEHMRTISGVQSAAFGGDALLKEPNSVRVRVPNDPRPIDLTAPTAEIVPLGPGYFITVGIPLRGRDFASQDFAAFDEVTATHVPFAVPVIVNQSFADRYLGSANPIGESLRTSGNFAQATIIGVAGDTRGADPNLAPLPRIYCPYDGLGTDAALFVRSSLTPPQVTNASLRILSALPGAVSPGVPETAVQRLDHSLSGERLRARILFVFGVVAFILAWLGVYALAALIARARRYEFAVRSALGASPGNVRGLVLAAVGRYIAAGLVAGLAAASLLRPVAGALLTGSARPSLLTFVLSALALVLAALLATALPAEISARIRPVDTLRHL